MSNIILTTGTYDLIKDHVRRKKVSLLEEKILTNEIKNAKQVLRRELPQDVVCINSILTYKNLTNNEEKKITIVGPNKSKPSKNKISILSDEAIAMVGHSVGSIIEWPSIKKGNLKLEIISVEHIDK